MVAYSFHATFADRVESRLKRQTIRGPRRRHARPGEPMQLYTAMRTKHCRKLVEVDPLCVGVDEVLFDLRHLAVDRPLPVLQSNADCEIAAGVVSIEINGIPLLGQDRHAFAYADGFVRGATFAKTGEVMLPFFDMIRFWLGMYGPIAFEGVCLRWEHRA